MAVAFSSSPNKCRGRGSGTNPTGRFEAHKRVERDETWDFACDGWAEDDEPAPLATTVTEERIRTIITRNESPDVPFDRSINPYRGCEHGCVYCYARPSHEYLGLSAGLDFETRLFAKPGAAMALRRELAKPGYRCTTLAMGTNTDPYQPVEKHLGITREILEVLAECNHPVGIVTKSHLVTRDIDILGPMAKRGLAQVNISVTTLDRGLARRLEPRAATPRRRLDAIRTLSAARVPVGVMVAPVIPGLNDAEIEAILDACADAGATTAARVMLRLPHGVKGLFRDWLDEHAPGRKERVLSLVRATRGGRDNDPRFFSRMSGSGPVAAMIEQRFEGACRRLGLNRERVSLDTTQFRSPVTAQLDLL